MPTRLDILPYTLSPFSPDNPKKLDLAIEIVRIILIMQVFVSVVCDLRTLNCQEIFSAKGLLTFGMDILLLAAQAFCYSIKMTDHLKITYNPQQIFSQEVRTKHIGYHFIFKLYRAQLIIEVFSITLFYYRSV